MEDAELSSPVWDVMAAPGDRLLIWTCRLEREWVGLKEGATTRREGELGPGVTAREGVLELEGEVEAMHCDSDARQNTLLRHIRNHTRHMALSLSLTTHL